MFCVCSSEFPGLALLRCIALFQKKWLAQGNAMKLGKMLEFGQFFTKFVQLCS